MAKMKSPAIALGLLLLLGLIVTPLTTANATANDEVRWSRVNIPADGGAGGWVLASGSDVQHLSMAIDGTLYAYGKGLTRTLLKSTDGGYRWSAVGQVGDSIVDIATAPNDAGIVYYATASSVYKSADAGNSFILLPPNPGGAGSSNVEITAIDVSYAGSYTVAAGTRDTDNGEYGGIYLLDEGVSFTWTDTNLGNYDAYAVAFSPDFPADRQLVAVVTDETDTFVTTRFGDNAWGATIGDVRLDRDNSGVPTPVAVSASADIAFPGDYAAGVAVSFYNLFIAIDTGSGNGDVYGINGTVATDLNIGAAYGLSNIDVTSVAVAGNAATASLLAGAASSARVYGSTDGGRNWTRNSKELTGDASTFVVMAPDFIGCGKAYVATSGTESAFSYTADGGDTWNQSGLLDTQISDIVDLAPSPDYGQDNTLFMLTWGGKHSLWRSRDGGVRWERVYGSALASVDSIQRVALPPQYGSGCQTVFIAGSSGGDPAIWRSVDNGQSFSSPWVTHDPLTGATFAIDAWAVVDDGTLFVGSYDGSNGQVYRTTNGGWTFDTVAAAGNQSLSSIALSPTYAQDATLLVGNTAGWVYWSNDNGATFEPLPVDATSAPFAGSMSVAFDSRFSSNNTVYAASDTPDGGIHRFIIGTSSNWVSIDTALPVGGMIGQLRGAAEGTLYATNFKADGGMERCLNPTYPLGPTFETVTRGLTGGATLTGLWQHDHRLWSIDTASTRLMTYCDSLTLPVSLTSPADSTSGIGTIINYKINDVTLDWEVSSGATDYKWQLDYDTDFSSIPAGFEGNCRATSARVPSLESATTYYWRVKATEPVLSPWSPKWSFTTSLGSDTVAPQLISPKAGAIDVGLKPIFQWSAVVGADRYELLVSPDASFAEPVVVKVGDYALPATAWQCDLTLDGETTYYWKVRAIGSATASAWSAVGAFNTDPPLAEPTPPPESLLPTPEPPPPSAPPSLPPDTLEWGKWLLYLAGALSLVLVAMLITLIILTVKVWRL